MAQVFKSRVLASTAWSAILASGFCAIAQDGGEKPRDSQAMSGDASADDGFEEVLVTARRRVERLQDVPVSATVLSAQRLEQLEIRDLNDIQFTTSSLQIAGGFNQAQGSYAIRGLGQGSFGQPSVTNYFSEAPTLLPNLGAPLFDLASIEILKGPQGTVFGRATTGGAVVITPARPDLSGWGGELKVTVGNLGRTEILGVLNVPLIDDELALRAVFQRNHVDGYTRSGSPQGFLLDETDNESIRLGLLWEPSGSGFSNYLVGQRFEANSTGGSSILVGYNPFFSLYNLPANASTPLGAAVGGAVFGATCTTAVNAGLAASVASCVNDRLVTLARYKPALAAEYARTQSEDAVRFSPVEYVQPSVYRAEVLSLTNVTTLELGDLGFSDITLKNIASVQRTQGLFSGDFVGLPMAGAHFVAGTTGGRDSGSTYQVGNKITESTLRSGPGRKLYTEEFQVNGNYNDGQFVWIAGAYFQRLPVPDHDESQLGSQNNIRIFEGVLTPNLGYSPVAIPYDGYDRETAFFAQGTLDLSFWVDGLSLTAGYRKTWNKSVLQTQNVVVQYPSGLYTRGAVNPASVVETDGYGWQFALDYKISPDVLVYATTRRGYKPGGNNLNPGIATALLPPGFALSYSPETVIDYEIGVKSEFKIGEMKVRLNVALYRDDYTDIQRGVSAQVAAIAIAYTSNVAEARLQGLEVETVFEPADGLVITANYSLNDSAYTKYFASDPLGIEKFFLPGTTTPNPACVTAQSSQAALYCALDLKDEPFSSTARHKGSVTVRYELPISDRYGTVHLAATVTAQSRVFFSEYTNRTVDYLGATFGRDAVRNMISQRGFALVNLRADWENVMGGDFSASLFVNNLMDETYSTNGLNNVTTLGAITKAFAEPRTFGLTVGYEF